jgi:FixJ family two-component response regulator
MADATPTVFVVDDDVSMRDSLRLLIESAGWRPEIFGSAKEFLARLRTPVPSCLLLDVFLPDINGCDLQQLLADRPDMPIIFISGHGDVPITVRAMKAGAVDFFPKPFASAALLSAIRGAIGRSLAVLSWSEDMRMLRDNYSSLSRRQREVMELVVVGQLNKQVGGALGSSEVTVKAHRGQVMHKMHAQSLPDLVRMADRLAGAAGEKS